MKSGCFACDVFVEGDDAASVADAFLAHASADHDWSYPEQALRNYAMNFAEARERVSNDVDRRETIGEVVVHRVTPDRIDDWLALFDRDGFADNPDWASCYCREPHDPGTEEEPERYWRDSREVMIDRLRAGTTFGYLAYVDGRPAGWVNASPRAAYSDKYRPSGSDDLDPASVIGVACFVVAPPYRRHGVAAALLDQVLADAAIRKASAVEGFPRLDPDGTDGGHFRGPREMYDRRGFTEVESRDGDAVVRRPV